MRFPLAALPDQPEAAALGCDCDVDSHWNWYKNSGRSQSTKQLELASRAGGAAFGAPCWWPARRSAEHERHRLGWLAFRLAVEFARKRTAALPASTIAFSRNKSVLTARARATAITALAV